MIAREPREWTVQPRGVEAADFPSRGDERPPQTRSRDAEIAEPVVKHENAHAGTRALGQRRNELTPDIVVRDDVVLEKNRALCLRDRLQPDGKVLFRILQETNRITRHERRTRSTRERLLGKDA